MYLYVFLKKKVLDFIGNFLFDIILVFLVLENVVFIFNNWRL